MGLIRDHYDARLRRNMVILVLLAAGILAYLVLAIAIFPSVYLGNVFSARKPTPTITSVHFVPKNIILGQPIEIEVSAINDGDDADMQTISVGFPNVTSADDIHLIKEDLPQKPVLISKGSRIGYGYTAISQTVQATYAAVEAQSWPWEHGKAHEIDLKVTPQMPGHFIVYVKSVAMPQTSQKSHFPAIGTLDQQGEFVEVYSIEVTKT